MIVEKVVFALKSLDYPGIDKLASNIQNSQKFLVPSFKTIDHEEITANGFLLAKFGLLRLPFAKCFFEFQNAGFGESGRICFYAEEIIEDLNISANVYVFMIANNRLHFKRAMFCWDYKGLGGFRSVPFMDGPPNECAEVESLCGILITALAAFDLREATLTSVVVKDRVVEARRRAGRPPLYNHSVLRVKASIRDSLRTRCVELVLKRAHFRRAHLRHLPGKIVAVSSSFVRGDDFKERHYVVPPVFGRFAQIEQSVSPLQAGQTTIVHAASGRGKSIWKT